MSLFQDYLYLIIGTLLRFSLLFIGEIQDRYFNVQYTDVDYLVYTDAAKCILEGRSPYDRHTYRYTPLVAVLNIPNITWHDSFGKILFSFIDVLCGFIIGIILKSSTNRDNKTIQKLVGIWMLNPVIFTVSTRGNADTLITLFVLLTLYFLLQEQTTLAGLCFGFSVHLQIYPIIYALPFYLYIDRAKAQKEGVFFTRKRILFTVCSAGFFLFLLGVFYHDYGWEFLYETYLYHFIRKDNRHNFSVYFYYIYLYFDDVTQLKAALCFLPQFILVFGAAFQLYKDLPFCMFVQTLVFVAFNQVITAQYFIWYMSLVPIILAQSLLFNDPDKIQNLIFLALLWLGTEMLWNLSGYKLEFQGNNSFNFIWIASMLFFSAQIFILSSFINNQQLEQFKTVKHKNSE